MSKQTLDASGALEAERKALAALCRQHGVARLEMFGSAARGDDFDPARSDADFLVTFFNGPFHYVDRESKRLAFLNVIQLRR